MQLQMMAANKKKGLLCVADWNFEHNRKIHFYWDDYDEFYTKNVIVQATEFWKKNVYPILIKGL